MDEQPYAVLVPYYSNPQYLRLALESVVAQTDPNWWCVVVDDSPDGAAGAVVSAVGDARVRHVRNSTNFGVAGNFQRCFDVAAEGGATLAMILHADDLLESEYVAVIRSAHAVERQAACIAPRATVIDERGTVHRPLADRVKARLWPNGLDVLEGGRGLQLLVRGQFFYCPAVSYRLDLMPDPAWTDRWRQVMDLDLYARVLLAGGRIALQPRHLYRYRRHAAATTESQSSSMLRSAEETALCRELRSAALSAGWNAAAREAHWRVTIRLQALQRIPSLLVRRRWREARRAAGFVVSL